MLIVFVGRVKNSVFEQNTCKMLSGLRTLVSCENINQGEQKLRLIIEILLCVGSLTGFSCLRPLINCSACCRSS